MVWRLPRYKVMVSSSKVPLRNVYFTHDIAWHTRRLGHASRLISVISTMVLYDMTYSGGTSFVERANPNTKVPCFLEAGEGHLLPL